MFYFYHLADARQNHAQGLLSALEGHQHLWGTFRGLFGLAANQLFVVTSKSSNNLPGVVLAHAEWHATARPQSTTALTKPGLYVFRRFQVLQENVEEVVALSQQAWQTFENDASYASEPVALFRKEDSKTLSKANNDEGKIVDLQLITWYDGFSSWSKSRTPHPEAAKNFQRRWALTVSTNAIATNLVT